MSQKDFLEAHKHSDVDAERSSYHHTLGKGANQAAPGNHAHLALKVQSEELMLGANVTVAGTIDVLTKTIVIAAAGEVINVTFNVSYDIIGASGAFNIKLNSNGAEILGGIAINKNSAQTDQATKVWSIVNPPVGNLVLKMKAIFSSGSATIRGFDTTIHTTRFYNA